MGRFSDNDAERIGVNENINENEKGSAPLTDGQGGCAFGTSNSAERENTDKIKGSGASEEKTADTVVDTPFEQTENTESNAGAVRGFTVMGLILLILSVAALGFGVYLACVCFSSAASASDALGDVLSIVSGGSEAAADAIGDAVVGLVSGVISTVAFGAAVVVLGRISGLLARKTRESESGELALLAKITSVVALVLSLAVFAVAVLIIIPWG